MPTDITPQSAVIILAFVILIRLAWDLGATIVPAILSAKEGRVLCIVLAVAFVVIALFAV